MLSPLLFNLYINDLPDIFEESCDPAMLQSFSTNVIMYADDLVLMSQTKEGLQKCLDRLYEYCQKWKLVVKVIVCCHM